MTHILTDISSIVFLFVGLLLIFVILLQRGRGGGLAGAFGGAGGQSAFGTKAGDVFTRITIGIAIVWVTMAVLTGYAMTYESGKTRFVNEKAADSKDGGAEGAVEPVGGGGAAGGGAADKANPFEAGSQDDQQAPAKGATKTTTTTPQKSPPAAAGKTAPATKTTPATPPVSTK
jgi:preprotein translocase subunit SecG